MGLLFRAHCGPLSPQCPHTHDCCVVRTNPRGAPVSRGVTEVTARVTPPMSCTFETVLPGRYLNGNTSRPRHVLYHVSAAGFARGTGHCFGLPNLCAVRFPRHPIPSIRLVSQTHAASPPRLRGFSSFQRCRGWWRALPRPRNRPPGMFPVRTCPPATHRAHRMRAPIVLRARTPLSSIRAPRRRSASRA